MHNQLKGLIKANQELSAIPFIEQLILIIEHQAKEIADLKAEIRMLKEHPKKPNIRPSTLDKPHDKASSEADENGRQHRGKRKKKPYLPIDKTEKIFITDKPIGSVFKGYKKVIIQDIEIKRMNTLYLLEVRQNPDGKYIYGQLPDCLQGTDFGVRLKSFIHAQYHQCGVTQPLLHEQLKGFGIDISTGQISNILTKNNEEFHREKEEILAVGLQEFAYIQTDDTGARHQGKNGYCTFIGNEFFSYFKSTESKSRINFIELLRGKHTDYYLDENAFEYFQQQELPHKYINVLSSSDVREFADKTSWQAHLNALGISSEYAIRTITQGALIASIIKHGIRKDLTILSDDAGQFNILLHALCWIHAERNIKKLNCYTQAQQAELEKVVTAFWDLYQKLKEYKTNPSAHKALQISSDFNAIAQTKTNWLALEQALQKLASNKEELLLVLQRPETPLNNNTSERDIREYVKRRKISGSTRSDMGREARDTFASLKKTCKKLQISFWEFLNDRISKTNAIENLAVLVKKKATYSPVSIACHSG